MLSQAQPQVHREVPRPSPHHSNLAASLPPLLLSQLPEAGPVSQARPSQLSGTHLEHAGTENREAGSRCQPLPTPGLCTGGLATLCGQVQREARSEETPSLSTATS